MLSSPRKVSRNSKMQVCRNKEYFSAKPQSGGALYLRHSQHCVKSDKIRTEIIPFPSKLKFRAVAIEFVLIKLLKRLLIVEEGFFFVLRFCLRYHC